MSDAIAPRRRVWPWIVAAVVVVALIGGAVYAFSTLGAVYSRGPVDAVEALHTAIEDVDCAEFQAVTSEEVRAASFSATGIFACDEWTQIAESFRVDGEYEYTVTVKSSEIDGTHAIVMMDETDGSKDPVQRFETGYGLDLIDGSWIVTGYAANAVTD